MGQKCIDVDLWVNIFVLYIYLSNCKSIIIYIQAALRKWKFVQTAFIYIYIYKSLKAVFLPYPFCKTGSLCWPGDFRQHVENHMFFIWIDRNSDHVWQWLNFMWDHLQWCLPQRLEKTWLHAMHGFNLRCFFPCIPQKFQRHNFIWYQISILRPSLLNQSVRFELHKCVHPLICSPLGQVLHTKLAGSFGAMAVETLGQIKLLQVIEVSSWYTSSVSNLNIHRNLPFFQQSICIWTGPYQGMAGLVEKVLHGKTETAACCKIQTWSYI